MAVVVKALAKGTTVEAAAAAAGFGRTTLYEWRRISELFRNAWADAVKESARPVLVAATGPTRWSGR